MDLVNALIPRPEAATLRAGLLAGQAYLHSFGITGWQEAILGAYAGYPDGSPIYRGLMAEGLLTGQAAGALWVPRETTLEDVPGTGREFPGPPRRRTPRQGSAPPAPRSWSTG